MSTLAEILASQQHLIEEAALALPHQFNQCTYPLGYIRQAVYLCKTCALPRGICSACSVACHTDHEQVELFPKRHFRCDCPTSAIQHPCTLHKTCEAENTENSYGQNFKGTFCRCGRPYDSNQERETMIQCLSCEVNIEAKLLRRNFLDRALIYRTKEDACTFTDYKANPPKRCLDLGCGVCVFSMGVYGMLMRAPDRCVRSGRNREILNGDPSRTRRHGDGGREDMHSVRADNVRYHELCR